MEVQTRTHIYDAISHNNYRSELRLDPNRIYSASLRLGQLGVKDVDDLKYNALSGVYSLIRNIYLMNNSDVLDQLYEAHNFLAFNTSVQNENANNFSLWNHLNGNSNAYTVGYKHTGGDGINENKIAVLPSLKWSDILQGHLNLQRCFNVLQQLPNGMLDTGVFSNLRIVIEWRDRAEWPSCFQGDVANAIANMSILQPQLYADEVLNPPEMPKSYRNQFLTFELDRIYCLGGADGATVQTKQRCNAFTGKYVERVFLMNVKPDTLTSNSDTDAIKCDGSTAFKNELINVVVDGHTVIDFPGCDTTARKLGILTDCIGDVCLPVGANKDGLLNVEDLYRDEARQLVGKMSFFACFVRNYSSELMVHHQRTLTADEHSPFWLYVIGQVGKQLEVSSGAYLVSYI
jgi:hypothetical protein